MSRQAINAGKAVVEIGIRNRIAAGAKGIQSDLDKIGRKVTALGGIVGGIGLSLGAPFAFAAGKLASFDDAMRSVGAISQSTDKQLAMLTETAKELGRTTSFTAVDVATLMTELGRAGFDPTQIDGMTAAVLNLSRATGTEAAMSAGILAATIRQFGLGASDATRVADGLTAAANKSFNSVESLGEAMQYAGPVAADLGMSLEETLAIMGTLGNVGIQGSSAGTAIKRLATLSAAEADKMQSIFGVAFKDAAGNALPLIDVLGDVSASTMDLGTATRAAKFNEAFGLLGITAAGALGKAAGSTRELLTAIESASGIAASTAEKMDAGLGGSFRKIASAAEGVAIAVGESFAPALQTVTDLLTNALGGVTEWVQENQALVVAVVASSVALVGTGAALIAFGVSAQLAGVAVGVMSTGFGIAAGAIGMMGTVMTVVKAATLATSAAFAFATGSSAGMAAGIALVNAAYAISPAVAGMAVAAWGFVGAVLTGLSGPAGLATAMAGILSTAWASAAAVVASAWAVITAPIMPFIIAGAAAVAVIGTLVAVAGYAAIAGMNFGAAWDIAISTLGNIMRAVKDTFDVIRSALGSGDYATAAKALWLGVQVVFWEGVEGAMKAFSWLWSEAFSTAKRFFSALLSTTYEVGKALVMAITSPFESAKKIGGLIRDMVNTATSFDVGDRAAAAKEELASMRMLLKLKKEQDEIDKTEAPGGAKAGSPRAAGGQAAPAAAEDGPSEKEQDKQVAAIFKDAKKLSADGMSPDKIFAQVMAQITRDQQSGRLGKDAADGAREQARENLDDRREAIQAEGKALADALRTPAEVLADRLDNVSRLQAEGAITSDVAKRAEADAREDFQKEEERNAKKAEEVSTEMESEMKRTGPSASFSASAAAVIGMGGGGESPALKAARETAKNTAMIAKQNKRNQVARFQ